MKTLIGVLALALLAACGAEDPPFRPTGGIDVGFGPGGIRSGARIGATNGTVSVGLGL